jgi:hypothetical protein
LEEKAMHRNNVSIGVLLIAVAVVLLLGKLGVFSFLGALLWPMFVLIPGLLFHFLYFGRMFPAGVLVPGGILVTYSLMFFYCNVFGWGSMSYLWPGFIFGVAVGLFEMYFFEGQRERGLFTASAILTAIAAIFFGMTVLAKLGIYFIALVLVAAGLLMIWRKPKVW